MSDVPPVPAPIIPGVLAGPAAPPAPKLVSTPSGQTIEVLADAEKSFYEGQAARYQAENKFTNTSDLLDLDRLVFLELLVYRASAWLGSGSQYDGLPLTDRGEAECRRALKENSELISRVKNDLGLTKAARDKADYESVGAYVTQLKQRAKEFGVHRETQLIKGITLVHQLFAILGAFDRSDSVERQKIGFEAEADVLDWIRNTMKPEFQAVDDHFAKNVQRYWTDV
jgi:hypothetical protein